MKTKNLFIRNVKETTVKKLKLSCVKQGVSYGEWLEKQICG